VIGDLKAQGHSFNIEISNRVKQASPFALYLTREMFERSYGKSNVVDEFSCQVVAT
jgi:hypothetical protein